MKLLNLLSKIFEQKKPKIHCASCPTCGIFKNLHQQRHLTCVYKPNDEGGCKNYMVSIPPRIFILDSFKDTVYPVPGSVVVCDLRMLISPLAFDHTGIFDGNGKIIHRDGDGYLARVSPHDFVNRLGGLNGALSIYVACCGKRSVGSKEALERAEAALEDSRINTGYHLLLKNCHQFTQYCLIGKIQQICFFSDLENTLGQYFGVDNWRMWNINPYDDSLV